MKCIFLFFAILSLALSCNNPGSGESMTPSTLSITEFVYASASVVPKKTYYSRPSRSGIIEKIFIGKGDKVKKGQALFSISATADAHNRLSNAAVNLQEAKDNLSGANSKLAGISIELLRLQEQNQIDSSNYQKRKRLWDQNIGSENELDRVYLVYQSSSSRLLTLKLDYQQAKSSLENQYEKAQNLVYTEQSLLGDLVVKSKIDGKVFSIFKEVGEFISPQENFAEIGNVDNYIIEMNIDEVDISKIEIGDTAIIQLEAYPDTVYTSTLVYISEIKDANTQTFRVEGLFTENPSKLFSGLAGEANILIDKRDNAIVVPSNYIIEGNKVMTKEGLVNVKIGVKSLEFVEILGGVDTSTILLKPESR